MLRFDSVAQMKGRAGRDSGRLSARVRWAIGALVVLLAAAGGAIAFVLTRPAPPPPVGTGLGQTAPDFTLKDLQGRTVALSDFRGKAVLLCFWQSTCPDCSKALPELWALRDRYGERGVVLVGVNLDHELEAAVQYLEGKGYTDLITLWESFDAAMGVVALMNVPLVPYAFLIDRRGVIRFSGTYPALPQPEEIERWL